MTNTADRATIIDADEILSLDDTHGHFLDAEKVAGLTIGMVANGWQDAPVLELETVLEPAEAVIEEMIAADHTLTLHETVSELFNLALGRDTAQALGNDLNLGQDPTRIRESIENHLETTTALTTDEETLDAMIDAAWYNRVSPWDHTGDHAQCHIERVTN